MSAPEANNPHAECERRLNEALERIARLEEQLARHSGNSSCPPSSDTDKSPERRTRPRSGRKPGGQPGHRGHRRSLLAVEPQNVQEVIPSACKGCGGPLAGAVDPAPLRHQVVEIPPCAPLVHEWRLHSCRCENCGATTRASLPDDAPAGGFGPRLVSTIALLTGSYRMSKRLAVEVLQGLFGVPISLGSITACERIASRGVAAAVETAQQYVREQPLKHADETGWYEGPQRARAWLWAGFTPLVSVFLIRPSRGADVARELLGPARGILVSDRYAGYSWWPTDQRQLCWAHIKRHFQEFADSQNPEARRIGKVLLRHQRELFRLWRCVRDGTLKHASFSTSAIPIRRKIKRLLDQGLWTFHSKTVATCRELLALEPAMWKFAVTPGIEPTNNPAERAVRPGVILRKLTFGTHSSEGSRYIERMLTVVHTLKQQGRSAIEFVSKCVHAQMAGLASDASLLPACS